MDSLPTDLVLNVLTEFLTFPTLAALRSVNKEWCACLTLPRILPLKRHDRCRQFPTSTQLHKEWEHDFSWKHRPINKNMDGKLQALITQFVEIHEVRSLEYATLQVPPALSLLLDHNSHFRSTATSSTQSGCPAGHQAVPHSHKNVRDDISQMLRRCWDTVKRPASAGSRGVSTHNYHKTEDCNQFVDYCIKMKQVDGATCVPVPTLATCLREFQNRHYALQAESFGDQLVSIFDEKNFNTSQSHNSPPPLFLLPRCTSFWDNSSMFRWKLSFCWRNSVKGSEWWIVAVCVR